MAPELNEVPLGRPGQDQQAGVEQLLDARQALIAERFGSAQNLAAELLGATTDTQAVAAAGREATR